VSGLEVFEKNFEERFGWETEDAEKGLNESNIIDISAMKKLRRQSFLTLFKSSDVGRKHMLDVMTVRNGAVCSDGGVSWGYFSIFWDRALS
jgi:hypothetical protein